jgi:hypothetical protein
MGFYPDHFRGWPDLSFLIPKNDKNPLPPPYVFKEAQGLMIFDFFGPTAAGKIREQLAHVNGV